MGINSDLTIGMFVIDGSELQWSFDPSGGPGGQHANRASSRATLRFDLGRSTSLPEVTRTNLIQRLGTKVKDGVVTISVDETRSQWRNRSIARRRLVELIGAALIPERTRKATRPSAGSRRRRLEGKRRRGETKRLRRSPEPDID